MNIAITIISFFIQIPVKLKGAKIGLGTIIGFGYDWLFVQMKNIKIGRNCIIGCHAWMQTCGDGKIEIGDKTSIGRNVTISASKSVIIGKGCLFSYNVSILDHNHFFKKDYSPVDTGLTGEKGIKIEDNCFVGAHSFILPGVTLGKNCIVGANSVVTKSFPDCSIIAGSPATFIKTLE